MGWVKGASLFCSHSCMTNEESNVDHGHDEDIAIMSIKDSMCKFVFKYTEKLYDCFQSPNSTIFATETTFNPYYIQ